jgi:hypothetical protein
MDRSFEPWTPEEEEKLAQIYHRYGAVHAARTLGRSVRAVVGRAHDLGISVTKRRWSEQEDEYLRRHYGEATAIEIAEDLDRTEQSVRARIHTMGLGEAASRSWTPEEIRYLKKSYGKLTVRAIAEALGRTGASVELKANRLGFSRQTRHEIPGAPATREIVGLLGTVSMTELAERYNTSVHIITQIAREHGYRERPTSRAWTEVDDADLRDLYGTMSHEEVARRLDRTVVAIKWRASVLGLTRQVTRVATKLWSGKEEARLRSLARTSSVDEIAQKLGRTVNSVRGKLQMMGLRAAPKRTTQRRS